MEVTLTIPESILTQLQQRAIQLNISLNELALNFFKKGIDTEQPRISLPTVDEVDELPSLEDVISRVKAIPPNPEMITQGSKVGDMAYAQELLDNPPTDTLTMTQWEEHWPLVEQELKEMDYQHAIANGRM